MAKLAYTVAVCSGADPDFPATELNIHSPHTRGWQTPRFCEYPQEVVVELTQGATISQIQILSHQHKIASRVELFIGTGATGLDHALWTRLGYLSLDTNERSQYQARELKSVYVDAHGRYLKFVAHRCHINRANLFNQVGIIAMNVLGQYNADNDAGDDPDSYSALRRDRIDDLAFDINVDPRAAQQIRSLLAAKEAAIEAEDYDAAKRLKTAEMQLRALGGQLAQLEVAKRRAVRDEDYDRAKLLKDEILALRRRVSEALQECAIVAITQSCFEEQQPSPPSPPMLEDSMTIKSFAANDVLSKSSKPSSTPSSLEMTAPSQLRELPHTTVLPPSMLDEDENDQLGSLEDILAPVSSSITGELQLLTHSPEPLSKTPQVTDERGALDGAFDHSQSDAVSSLRSEDVLQNAHLAGSDFGSAMKVEPHALNALSSVPNAAELPVPEPFASDMGGDSDIAAVIALLGDYRARCLFSKNWALREAALAKTRILLHKDNWERFEDLEQLCDVAQLGVHDKIAQVYLTALALLDDVAHKFAARGFKRTEAFPALEPALAAVVTKLGDNQPRLRDKAVDALTSLSRCRVVGADRVAEKVMRSLDKRRPPHNKWRPIATRLEFLKCLACEFGVENRDASRKGSHALVLESVIAFVETHGCASHTFEEVRTAAKDLVVDVFATVSDADRERLLDPFLNKLRPKQAEEYRIAVDRGLSRHINNLNNDRSNSILRTLKAAPAPKAAPQQFSSPMLEAIPSTTTASSYCPSHIRDIPTYDGDNESQRSEDPEEERFRDQIMKQLEEKAFSVMATAFYK